MIRNEMTRPVTADVPVASEGSVADAVVSLVLVGAF
jgi:hypothetical protein